MNRFLFTESKIEIKARLRICEKGYLLFPECSKLQEHISGFGSGCKELFGCCECMTHPYWKDFKAYKYVSLICEEKL